MRAVTLLLVTLCSSAIGFWGGRLTASSPGPGVSPSSKMPGAAGASARISGKTPQTPPGEKSAEDLLKLSVPGQPNAALTTAMQSALGNTLETRRLSRWIKLLEVMRPEDAPAIQQLLQSEAKAGRKYGPENTAFWQTWGGLDPKGAWAYAVEHADSGGKHGAEDLTKAWAMKDSAGACDAVAAIEDSPFARKALAGLMHGLAESDSAAAVRFASTRLPQDLLGDCAIHIAGSMIYQMGNQAVQGWFDNLPPEASPEFKRETARVLIESLGHSEPGEVAKFALSHLDQSWAALPDEQRFTLSMIQRAGGEPWDYLEAVMQKFPDPENPLALATMAAARDLPAAEAWAAANPDRPAADKVLAGVARMLINKGNSQEAEAVMARIRDPQLAASLQLPPSP